LLEAAAVAVAVPEQAVPTQSEPEAAASLQFQ